MIYGVETEGIYKDPIIPKKGDEGETMATQSDINDDEANVTFAKPKINVIRAPANEQTIAVFGLAQNAVRIEPNKLRSGTESTTPTRKPVNSNSHSQPYMKPVNPRQIRPRKEGDISGLRSYGDLESTLKCNISGQVDEKPNKYFVPSAADLPISTEHIRTAEDEPIKTENNNGIKNGCELGKAMSAGCFGYSYLRRRNSKSNRIPEKVRESNNIQKSNHYLGDK